MQNYIIQLLNLQKGEQDKQKTLNEVKENINVTGSNLWILACAILIASVGLNVNSTAVIIGAMLISPLMGPIVGSGFALGIYDFDLLKKSLKNLLISTFAALFVSTLYFYLSPFKEAQSELLARTSPNIYDVMIAFFGGLVGVIAMTRVEKGNPIPGVAIATALMPPLCTAGFGLATGNFKYFFGALFLYSINCVFICIATFSIVKYLKYPPKIGVDDKHQKNVKYGLTTLIFLMLVPSGYFAYSMYKKQQLHQIVELFIDREFTTKGFTVIYKKTNLNSNPKVIELAFLTKKFDANEISILKKSLKKYGIDNTNLLIKQDAKDIKSEILNEIGNQNKNITKKDLVINQLQQKLSEYTFEKTNVFNEISILFPDLKCVSLGKHINIDGDLNAVLLFESDKKIAVAEISKIKLWLELKLQTKNIQIVQVK